MTPPLLSPACIAAVRRQPRTGAEARLVEMIDHQTDALTELRLELGAAHYCPSGGLPGWVVLGGDWSQDTPGVSLGVSEAFSGDHRVWTWVVCLLDPNSGDYHRAYEGTESYPRQAMRAAEAALRGEE